MMLVQFIKSKLSQDDSLGDLARDIQGDAQFPADKTDAEIISYLHFRTRKGGTNDTLRELLQQFVQQSGDHRDTLDLDARFAVLRTEQWAFYKAHFSVDQVILVGSANDIYKAYGIDSASQKALFFDLKSKKDLNDIAIVDVDRIYIGHLTQQVNIAKAIDLLEHCSYDTRVKPNEATFPELIAFLKSNLPQ